MGILEPMRILIFLIIIASQLSFAIPNSELFNYAWDDYSAYQLNLKPQEWPILDKLQKATIYRLEFDIKDNTSIEVKSEILITNQEDIPLKELYFHLYPNLLGGELLINSLKINEKDAEYYNQDLNTVLAVILEQELKANEQVLLKINYSLIVPQDFDRNYGLFTYLSDVLTLGHAYPILAVYNQDGWHTEEPPEYGDLVYADSSFFQVRIIAPKELVIVSSGEELSKFIKKDKQILEVAAGPVRDFFISASKSFKSVAASYKGTTVNSYYLDSNLAANAPNNKRTAEQILEIAISGLKIFGERIGDYPYSELDYVPIDTSALGIEFPSAIAMTQNFYGRNNNNQLGGASSFNRNGYLESTTIHELAHQWYYGLIGNDQLNEPWLDEAMAQYATLLYFGQKYGPSGYGYFRKGLKSRWNGENLVIGLPVSEYSSNEYLSVVYGLGPLVIEQLAKKMGTIKFNEFLKDYYQRTKFRISSSQTFLDIAEETCECKLDNFFKEWILP